MRIVSCIVSLFTHFFFYEVQSNSATVPIFFGLFGTLIQSEIFITCCPKSLAWGWHSLKENC